MDQEMDKSLAQMIDELHQASETLDVSLLAAQLDGLITRRVDQVLNQRRSSTNSTSSLNNYSPGLVDANLIAHGSYRFHHQEKQRRSTRTPSYSRLMPSIEEQSETDHIEELNHSPSQKICVNVIQEPLTKRSKKHSRRSKKKHRLNVVQRKSSDHLNLIDRSKTTNSSRNDFSRQSTINYPNIQPPTYFLRQPMIYQGVQWFLMTPYVSNVSQSYQTPFVYFTY